MHQVHIWACGNQPPPSHKSWHKETLSGYTESLKRMLLQAGVFKDGNKFKYHRLLCLFFLSWRQKLMEFEGFSDHSLAGGKDGSSNRHSMTPNARSFPSSKVPLCSSSYQRAHLHQHSFVWSDSKPKLSFKVEIGKKKRIKHKKLTKSAFTCVIQWWPLPGYWTLAVRLGWNNILDILN